MVRSRELLAWTRILRASSFRTPRLPPPSLSSVPSANGHPGTDLLLGILAGLLVSGSKANLTTRHHLDIHDPAKASRYKCDNRDCNNRGCEYASRYPKDVRRHKLVHSKPDFAKYVCHEPDCDGKFDRNDNLLRHIRLVHPDSASAQTTGATANSRLGNNESSPVDVHLVAGGSMNGPRAALLEPFDSMSNHSAGASLNNFGFVVDRTSSFSSPQTAGSSFKGFLDPRFMSPGTASDSFIFSETESPRPK